MATVDFDANKEETLIYYAIFTSNAMAGSYEQEQAELKLELTSIPAQVSEMGLREKYVKDFMENARA